MKVRYDGKTEKLILTHGKVYEVLSIERGDYRIIADLGEDYLFPRRLFTIVSEEEKPPERNEL